MRIIIPMAGKGKRMRPHTLTVAKPLIPAAGKPIVQRLVEDITKVCGQKVEEIAFVIGSDFGKETEQNLITTEIRNYWKSLRKFKSRSQFGIAKNTFDVISSIIKNNELIVPASIVLNGEYGEKDVSMGILVKINKDGIKEIIGIKLNLSEHNLLKISAQTIRECIHSL